ncbi:zinc metalloprotease [Conglomerata obtusa]
MIEEAIIYGSLFVTLLEVIINIKQKITLIQAKQDDKAKLMIEDEKEFNKMRSYNIEKLTLSNIREILSMLRLFLAVRYNLHYELYNYIKNSILFKNDYYTQILTMIALLFIEKVSSIPFSLISTFYIEQKYGFNKMTASLYISDFIKTEILTYLIASPVCYAMLYVISAFPKFFYMQLFAAIASIQLILIVLFPIVIQPIFNKFEELKEGDLKTKIIELAKKVGFRPSKILTMDGSKRSHHSNAYFIGIFKEKRIVLFDTLLTQNTDNEILAILCHEFGHWFYSHTFKQIITAFVTLFIYIYSFNYFVKQETCISHFPMILKFFYFGMLMGFINPLTNLLTNAITRRYERQADIFAVERGYGEDLKSGLVKLHVKNKSNMCPDRWYSVYYHSHPTLFERIELVDNHMKKME